MTSGIEPPLGTPVRAVASLPPPDRQAAPDRAPETDAEKPFHPFGEDGFSFADFIDIINPLQHIPVVSTLYRHITGDTIDPAARILGDGLFGGPIGFAAGAVNAVIDHASGKDVGEHVLAFFIEDTAETPTLADLPPPPSGPGGLMPVAVASEALAPPPSSGLLATADPPPATTPSPLPPAPDSPSVPALDSAFPAIAGFRAALIDAQAESRPARTPAGPPPPGTPGRDGGWFAEAMLEALAKYEKAMRHGDDDPDDARRSAAASPGERTMSTGPSGV